MLFYQLMTCLLCEGKTNFVVNVVVNVGNGWIFRFLWYCKLQKLLYTAKKKRIKKEKRLDSVCFLPLYIFIGL